MPRKTDPLDVGDTIEIAVTSEVKNKRGLSLWIKAGVVSSVRPGETSEEAVNRVTDFVVERVGDLNEEFLS